MPLQDANPTPSFGGFGLRPRVDLCSSPYFFISANCWIRGVYAGGEVGPYCLKRNGYRRAYVASFEDVTEGSWLEVVVAIAQSCSRAWLICPRRRTGLSLRYWIAMVSRCSCVSTPESRSLR